MNESVLIEFGDQKPQAMVLDDHERSRRSISRSLKAAGFDVVSCGSPKEFFECWAPGMFDLIVADWQLSDQREDHGDKVLQIVRSKDWDVPFVLVSGKLDEHHYLPAVLQILLEQGQARFVMRGNDEVGSDDVFQQIGEEALRLLERRDTTLLRVILALRGAARKNASFRTTRGEKLASDQLADLVASPLSSHDGVRPIADYRAAKIRRGD